MAKRKVAPRAPATPPEVTREHVADGPARRQSFTPASLLTAAVAMLAAAIVVAGLWPNDSIEVQAGGARYLVGLLLVTAIPALLAAPRLLVGDWLLDALAWGVALWMGVAVWANADQANLRLAFNELWWWVAAAALFSAARRGAAVPQVARPLAHLIMAVSLAVAVCGWHQLLIGFPAMIADYQADPERVLRDAGIFAEPGSAQRIIFENRLYDGGPTGTFALANSMAALLVGGVVMMALLLAQRWRGLTVLHRAVWSVALLITSSMLLASRSRSAVAAVLLVALAIVGLRWAEGRFGTVILKRRSGRIAAAVLALVIVTLGITAAIRWRVWSESEWVAQAPASLAIRLNYWRACARMLAESPLVGVGPGQFKARYEAYRAAEASEQIADPHNWIWQALTTGGLPAGVLLMSLVAVILWRCATAGRAADDAPATAGSSAPEPPADLRGELAAVSSRAVYTGAAIALLIGGAWGAVIGSLPAIGATLVACGLAVALVVVAARSEPLADEPTKHLELSRAAGWALTAMLVNLLAAGGIAVPGVAVPLWVLAGIAAPCRLRPATNAVSPQATNAVSPQATQTTNAVSPQATAPRVRDRVVGANGWLLGASGGLLLLVWYNTALLPVEQAAGMMGRFEHAWRQGRYGEAESALQEATLADRFDPQPPLQLSQLQLQQALFVPQQRQRWEASWRQSEAECLRRAGGDPAILRMLADGRLWHYQRYGDPESLRAAAELYRLTVELSPSHQSYAAQLAEVYRELLDARAGDFARTAQTLSLAGGYYERSLPFIMVLVARPLGEAALAGPRRQSAAEVLAPWLERPN